jgi:hypothetical protein
MSDGAQVNTPEELGGEWKRWSAEIHSAKEPEDKFRRRVRAVEERYRDEKEENERRPARRFNILWSNTEILTAALTQELGKQIIERRYRDQDPVGRAAAQALDRAVGYHIDETGYEDTIRAAIFDAVLGGRGTLRLRYVPEFGPPMMTEQGPVPQVVYEEAATEYVHWSDFMTSAARIWPDVRWVSFRALMTREQGRERFGKKFDKVPLNWTPNGNQRDSATSSDENQLYNRAPIYEIWHKGKKEVVWWCPDYDAGLLDKQPDPLGLRGFFPCPRPLSFAGTNSDIIPIPEYDLYRDQADEIDRLTTRINLLISAIRAAGVYDQANPELQQFLAQAENTMTPIKNWKAFAESGGLKGALDFLPIEPMVKAIAELANARERIKQELYEVTGIGDIVRGASDPNETATAQRIKSNFASIRLDNKRSRVARFTIETLSIMTEIIAEHFSPETLKLMTGLKLPDTPEEAQMLMMQQQMQAMAAAPAGPMQ